MCFATFLKFQNYTVFQVRPKGQALKCRSLPLLIKKNNTCVCANLFRSKPSQRHQASPDLNKISWLPLCCCALFVVASELIKRHELEIDELRPLYMDFQATTPMVTATHHVVMVTCSTTWCQGGTYPYLRIYTCVCWFASVGPPGAGRHVALPGELLRQPSLQNARLRLGERERHGDGPQGKETLKKDRLKKCVSSYFISL